MRIIFITIQLLINAKNSIITYIGEEISDSVIHAHAER